MRVRIAVFGVLICLAAHTAGKPQGATAPNKSAPPAQQSLTRCVDEQEGRYVLLNDQRQTIASLEAAGSDPEVFAKHLGHKVQLTGAKTSGEESRFRVTAIKPVAGNCGRAK
jgi:hypothetical protein